MDGSRLPYREKGRKLSNKVSTYFPNYQLRPRGSSLRPGSTYFNHDDTYFVVKVPIFGATETQKAALRWASFKTPPVICVSHEKPGDPDIGPFGDPSENHRTYTPYAMAIATLECLGEKTPRRVKVYFCDIELHEDNAYAHIHARSIGTYIEPLV